MIDSMPLLHISLHKCKANSNLVNKRKMVKKWKEKVKMKKRMMENKRKKMSNL
jgi:hypothetical protein